jgi:hypothetical protein
MLAMPKRAKVFAQSQRAAAMSTYLRPTVHERDAAALCREAPKRRCRPLVEASVVGHPDPLGTYIYFGVGHLVLASQYLEVLVCIISVRKWKVNSMRV